MFAISPTNDKWFQYLKENNYNSFINFWTPTPWNIKQLADSDKLYFLLKSPIRKIGGYGEFHSYINLSVHDAWVKFGQRNGCSNKADLISRIQTYLEKNSSQHKGKTIDAETHIIGCIILKNCQFWEADDYIIHSEYNIDFAEQIVKIKYFNTYNPFDIEQNQQSNYQIVSEPKEEYKTLTNSRKGQSSFKGKILKSYNNRCCISGESCPELLEAAHIQQYLNSSSNHIQNGLLLRVDLHRLFDCGLLLIDPDYRVKISSILKDSSYYKYDGITISIPDNPAHHPSKASLKLRITNFRD
ncbi:MAG: HNH endonuclease [Flavipsychrobacter sp.]